MADFDTGLSPEESIKLVNEVNFKRSLWLSEYTNRKTYIEKMKRIIKGEERQIEIVDTEGRTTEKIKVPYAFTILKSLSQFLGCNPPYFSFRPTNYRTDPKQILQTQTQETLINQLLDDMSFPATFLNFSEVATQFGGGVLRLTDVGGIPKIDSIERPENLIIGWKGDDFREVEYYIFEYFLSPYQVKAKYGLDVVPEESNQKISVSKSSIPDIAAKWTRAGRKSTVSFVEEKPITSPYVPKGFVPVMYYVDEKREVTMVKQQVAKIKNHNYGFVPLYPFRNLTMLGEPWGVSDYFGAADLEKFLLIYLDQINDAMNQNQKEVWATTNRKIRKEDLQTDQQLHNILIHLDKGAPLANQIANMTASTKIDIQPMLEERDAIKGLISQQAFFPEQLFIANEASGAMSGRVVRMMYTRVINLIESKRINIEPILDQILRDMVSILRKKGPKEVKSLFPTELTCPIDIKWGSILPEELSQTVASVNLAVSSKLISRRTGQKMIDIADPDYEEFMKEQEQIGDVTQAAKLQQLMPQQPQQGKGANPPSQGTQADGTPEGTPMPEKPFEVGQGIPASKGQGGQSQVVSPKGAANAQIQHQQEKQQAQQGGL